MQEATCTIIKSDPSYRNGRPPGVRPEPTYVLILGIVKKETFFRPFPSDCVSLTGWLDSAVNLSGTVMVKSKVALRFGSSKLPAQSVSALSSLVRTGTPYLMRDY